MGKRKNADSCMVDDIGDVDERDVRSKVRSLQRDNILLEDELKSCKKELHFNIAYDIRPVSWKKKFAL